MKNKRNMILFELRNITGSPYVHLFGIAMPILMSYIVIRTACAEAADQETIAVISTSVFLGMGAIIPLAIALMGYAATRAQEMERGIPERLELFGIGSGTTLRSRIAAELIFIFAVFILYFIYGCLFLTLKAPALSGIAIYTACMLALTVIFLCIAHGIATFLKKFGPTYCLVMIFYFVIMLFSGMMGLSFDSMPTGIRAIAKLLPTTYINNDIYTIWTGERYRFAGMLQSFLLWAAIAGILFIASRNRRHVAENR